MTAVVVLGAGGVGQPGSGRRAQLGSAPAGAEAIALITTGREPQPPCPGCDQPPDADPGVFCPIPAGPDRSGPAAVGDGSELSFNDLLVDAMAEDGLTFVGGGASQEELFRRLVAWQEGSGSDPDVGALDPRRLGPMPPPADTPTVGVGVGAAGLLNPVPGAVLFDSFGFPRSGGRLHRGIDIFAPEGTPVIAARGGVVVQVRGPGARPEGELGGRTVTIAGDDGRFYYYAHHAQNLVAEGDRVARGDRIGLVGRTGNARTTAAHLHFGISEGGTGFSESRAVNPYPLLVGGPATSPAPTPGPGGESPGPATPSTTGPAPSGPAQPAPVTPSSPTTAPPRPAPDPGSSSTTTAPLLPGPEPTDPTTTATPPTTTPPATTPPTTTPPTATGAAPTQP